LKCGSSTHTDLRELLAVARDEVEPALDRPQQVLVGGGLAVEDEDPGDVHVRAAGLEVEERGVEPGEAVAAGHDRDSCAHDIQQVV
jgi:hypothetical protein